MWEEREEKEGRKNAQDPESKPRPGRNTLGVSLSGTSSCVRHAAFFAKLQKDFFNLHSTERRTKNIKEESKVVNASSSKIA